MDNGIDWMEYGYDGGFLSVVTTRRGDTSENRTLPNYGAIVLGFHTRWMITKASTDPLVLLLGAAGPSSHNSGRVQGQATSIQPGGVVCVERIRDIRSDDRHDFGVLITCTAWDTCVPINLTSFNFSRHQFGRRKLEGTGLGPKRKLESELSSAEEEKQNVCRSAARPPGLHPSLIACIFYAPLGCRGSVLSGAACRDQPS